MSDITLDTRTLSFPADQISTVRALVKKYGWKLSRKKKSGIEEALDDIKHGRVTEIKDIDEFIRNL